MGQWSFRLRILILLGVVLLSVSSAYASEITKACECLSPDDISSVLGPASTPISVSGKRPGVYV